jgi:flavin-dependent dehydrogenase
MTDVVVIGGGPAGLATAIAARAHGLRCLVAERRLPPADKTCGEGLMPDGVRALRRLGVELTPADGAPFSGIRFVSGAGAVEGCFAEGDGIGVRRPVLHARLAQRAERVGVDLRWGEPSELLDDRTVRVGRERVAARWVVGADGVQSRVRRRAGLEAGRRRAQRFAVRVHYQVRPWSPFVEVHWTASGQLYVTPVGRDEVCVVFVARTPVRSVAAGLAECPALAARLAAASESSRARGGLSTTERLRTVVAGSLALVGDASGSVDAITGEGLALAFRQATALAEALAAGRLPDYVRAHRRLARRPRAMAALLLSLERWPRFGRRALPALGRTPWLFAELLALHVGRRPRARVLVPGALRLGYGLLRPAGSCGSATR